MCIVHKPSNRTLRNQTGKRERQNRRWRDELRIYRGIAWQQTAQDRVKWRHGEEAFLLNGVK